ncbi:MAG: sigma-70 family RNA polymerase sigma factor [Luteolibacter sp.]|jgi:RNA polymerase sigma-70 factor (ECF subfamily)|nr:sigma-70 family RNA polymerase sigma factor [Luteolibacter sp.]
MLKKQTAAEKQAEAAAAHLAAVQALFVDHLPIVRSLVLALWPDFDGANDIVQETFLTVNRRAASFKLGTDFTAWVASIARFKIKEAWASKYRSFEILSPKIVDSLISTMPGESDRQLELSALKECMERLSPKAGAIVEMRYEQSHSLKEIGDRIGWTAGSVHVALSRARMLLRDCVHAKLAKAQ